MDKRRNKVRLACPQDNNQVFEIEETNDPSYVALKDSRGCYMGFNSSGRLEEPCGLTRYSYQVPIHLVIFKRKKSRT